MATIEQSIDVEVPVETAYNQWTQFEEFPRFMEGVEEVRQLDDTTLHWKVATGSPSSAAAATSVTRSSPSSIRMSGSPGATPTARRMPAW